MAYQILYQLSIYSVFPPLLIGIFNYRNLELNTKLLLLLLFFASVPHALTAINDLEFSRALIYNSYILAESVFWPLIFMYSIKNPSIKRMLFVLLPINLILTVTYLITYGIVSKFHSELVCLNNFFQIIYIIILFYAINKRNEFIVLRNVPMFWVSAGLLFYATCTFFIFLYYDKINSYMTKSELNILWQIHNVFNVLMYLMFSKGLLIKTVKSHV